MFTLYGNNKILEKCKTLQECKEQEKDYKQIERAMVGHNKIKFKIVEEI